MSSKTKPAPAMRIAQQMRLAWLETVAISNGPNGISRDDITLAWGTSATQASDDIKEYMRITGNDGRLQYNGTARRYMWHGTARTVLMDRSTIEPLCRRILEPPPAR